MAALVARVDGGGRRQIVLANQALATLLGESVARLVGGDLTRFLPREDLSAGPFRDGAAKGGAAGDDEGSGVRRLLRHDGSMAWVETRVVPVELPGEEGPLVLAYLTDVTDRHEVLDRLMRSEESFRTMFENAPVGVAISRLNADGSRTVVRANQMLADMLGVDIRTLPGSYTTAFFVDDMDESSVTARMMDLWAGRIPEVADLRRMRRSDGTLLWVRARANRIDLSDVDGPLLLALILDVTAEHEANERRRRSLATLEATLLPHDTVTVPGVRIAARYRAASTDKQIGGDWYDSIALPEGGLGLVIGDVEGHDLTAASVMGLVRSAVHAYALEGHPPSLVLERANAFLSSIGTDRLVTLGYVRLHPGSRALTAAVAGHPPPWILPRDGTAACPLQLPAGLILGALSDVRYPERTVILPPGVDLILYTDGLEDYPGAEEDRIETVMAGARDAASAGASAEDVADAIVSSATPFDDVAVLVVRLDSADRLHQ